MLEYNGKQYLLKVNAYSEAPCALSVRLVDENGENERELTVCFGNFYEDKFLIDYGCSFVNVAEDDFAVDFLTQTGLAKLHKLPVTGLPYYREENGVSYPVYDFDTPTLLLQDADGYAKYRDAFVAKHNECMKDFIEEVCRLLDS